MGLMWLSNLVL